MLAAVAAYHSRRLRWASPWPLALAAFFLIRAVERGGYASFGDEPAELGFATDVLVGVVLLLLLVGHRRFVRRVGESHELARLREAEYQRALLHYRTLVRHRLANPITAIRGIADTLRSARAPVPLRVLARLPRRPCPDTPSTTQTLWRPGSG